MSTPEINPKSYEAALRGKNRQRGVKALAALAVVAAISIPIFANAPGNDPKKSGTTPNQSDPTPEPTPISSEMLSAPTAYSESDQSILEASIAETPTEAPTPVLTEAPTATPTATPTEIPSPIITETPQPEVKAAQTIEFISDGFVTTKSGDVERFIYKGGYHPEDDPYATKFQRKNDANYENDNAYGFNIEGDTAAEKTSNWLKNVMLSPEALVRLRVQMGIESPGSIQLENQRANELRTLGLSNPDEYDKIVNETTGIFYNRLQGGSIKESHDWILENYMDDEEPGFHDNSELHGRLGGDDETGDGLDLLLTFQDASGKNIVSSKQGFLNTLKDSNTADADLQIGTTAWVNMDQGGTWKWKGGQAPSPTEAPTISPTIEPTPVPTEAPTPEPTIPPKNERAEIDNAGSRVTQLKIGDITPPTRIEEDQANFEAIETQRESDQRAAEEAERIRAEQAERERMAAEQARTRAQEEANRIAAEEEARRAAEAAAAEAAAEEARRAAEAAAAEAAAAEEARRAAEQARIRAQEEARRAAEAAAGSNTSTTAGDRANLFANGDY